MVILGDYSSLDNGNITIIEQSTLDSGLGEGFTVNVGAAGGSTMNTRVCLPGEGRYSFVIFDSYYNGICCEFGGEGMESKWPFVVHALITLYLNFL